MHSEESEWKEDGWEVEEESSGGENDEIDTSLFRLFPWSQVTQCSTSPLLFSKNKLFSNSL